MAAAGTAGQTDMARPRKPITYDVDKDGCYICTSHSPSTHGYPMLSVNNKRRNMHRVLYEEAYGSIPDDIVIRHKCDNRRCINLEHLEPGTPGDNARDRKERGRDNPPIGDRSGTSKLTPEQVLAILSDTRSQPAIAESYGLHQSQVSRIKSGKRWAHLRGK